MSDPVLSVSDLCAYYQTSAFGIRREVRAVDGVSFQVGANEIYGLAGESSCGKTTLIRTIAAATRPPLKVVGGAITFNFDGRRVCMTDVDAEALADIRWKHLSCIMQGSMNVLNPVRRIRHSFLDFAFRHVGKAMPAFLEVVRVHLQRLALEAKILDAFPHQLSGGMRQRVAIALATVCRPDFIIADEPTTALDVIVQNSVLANLSDRLGIMYAGRLVEEGRTVDVFRKPLHPYTVNLISALPRIGRDNHNKGLEGAPPNLADPPAGCRFHPRCPLAMDICRREIPPMIEHAPGHRAACFAVTPETAQ